MSREQGARTEELTSRQRAPGGRVPDFFIVGHAKCGTTALHEMLRRHPQIYMPALKEPQFFAAGPGRAAAAGGGSLGFRGAHPMSLDDYLALFAAAEPGQVAGEASTFYLFSHEAPARIARAQPAARIVAIFREPASFVRSVHLQMLQNNAESETDLRAALALDSARSEGRCIPRHSQWPEALIYSERVRYVEQLRRYHEHFPPEHVLVLIYDDLLRDNEAAVRSVQRFLGVDDALPIEPVRANPSVALRSRRANQLRRALGAADGRLARAVRGAGRTLTTARVRRAVYYSNVRRASFREAPAPDQELMRELRDRFKGEVEAFGEYIGRDLAREWGYRGAR